jgi:hypothetical protein
MSFASEASIIAAAAKRGIKLKNAMRRSAINGGKCSSGTRLDKSACPIVAERFFALLCRQQ